ncbi:hypothetical protein [Nocardia sp. XZ_19_369]|uniref:hypothetical protein n=1 Tax=Nocardia sp. XZ_19_369 TaxID=2769487 RepID=UPI001890550E|nr:hypothetical protein [Nocardia sp. XZ_19_369]
MANLTGPAEDGEPPTPPPDPPPPQQRPPTDKTWKTTEFVRDGNGDGSEPTIKKSK